MRSRVEFSPDTRPVGRLSSAPHAADAEASVAWDAGRTAVCTERAAMTANSIDEE
jgi:hypothetical protein